MRTLVLFAAVCIASVLGDTDSSSRYHSSNQYLSGSTSGKYLGGSNYYRNRYQGSYPYYGRYRNQGGLYDNDYNGRLGLGSSLGYQDNMYPYSRSGFDYNDNSRYDLYDNNRYDNMNYNWRSRGGMYDNDRMYRGGSMYNNYDYNSRYNGPYNSRYNNRFNSRYNDYNDYNDYNRRYDSMSGGYPVFGSQTSAF